MPDEVVDGLCNDLSFSAVLPALHKLAKAASGDAGAAGSLFAALSFLGIVSVESLQSFAAQRQAGAANGVDTAAVEARVAERLSFLEAKNFGEADRIRDDLASEGILLKDGKGADGKRVTTWEVKR